MRKLYTPVNHNFTIYVKVGCKGQGGINHMDMLSCGLSNYCKEHGSSLIKVQLHGCLVISE